MTPLLLATLGIGERIIDRMFPDPAQKAAAELELLKLTREGELKEALAQLQINLKEAEHASIFVAGWRPWIGWGCGFGLLYHTIFHNILNWIAVMAGWPELPQINSDLLIYVLGAMLGVAGLRTYEKKHGIATK
jgi:hypothetical protein